MESLQLAPMHITNLDKTNAVKISSPNMQCMGQPRRRRQLNEFSLRQISENRNSSKQTVLIIESLKAMEFCLRSFSLYRRQTDRNYNTCVLMHMHGMQQNRYALMIATETKRFACACPWLSTAAAPSMQTSAQLPPMHTIRTCHAPVIA